MMITEMKWFVMIGEDDIEWYLETQEDCEDAGFMWVPSTVMMTMETMRYETMIGP